MCTRVDRWSGCDHPGHRARHHDTPRSVSADPWSFAKAKSSIFSLVKWTDTVVCLCTTVWSSAFVPEISGTSLDMRPSAIRVQVRNMHATTQQTQDVESMLVSRWYGVANLGPRLNQHWYNVLCMLGTVQSCIAFSFEEQYTNGLNRKMTTSKKCSALSKTGVLEKY